MPLNVNLTPLSPACHARFPPSTFSCHYLLIIAVYTYMQMIRHGSNKLHVQWLKGLKLLILKIDLDTISQHLPFLCGPSLLLTSCNIMPQSLRSCMAKLISCSGEKNLQRGKKAFFVSDRRSVNIANRIFALSTPSQHRKLIRYVKKGIRRVQLHPFVSDHSCLIQWCDDYHFLVGGIQGKKGGHAILRHDFFWRTLTRLTLLRWGWCHRTLRKWIRYYFLKVYRLKTQGLLFVSMCPFDWNYV